MPCSAISVPVHSPSRHSALPTYPVINHAVLVFIVTYIKAAQVRVLAM